MAIAMLTLNIVHPGWLLLHNNGHVETEVNPLPMKSGDSLSKASLDAPIMV